ncbi:peptidylprolyl isomerase [Tumebacillus sp. DT12]|uniref:Foldase protein PrsA n=1 Tax=Tumebacillus lacus TaxID=2995335 RepID=A0ABT3X871_9BACL|nr:peptidylprolyl isomerase [Tumebacillus lacus]MCX7572183.1 peptidylprolyl isomerase [Tumebacillus lacus]
MKKAIAGAVVGAVVVGGIWFFANTDKTVVSVGGEKITESQLHSKLEQMQGKEVLKRMIDDQVIRNQAKELKIEVTDAEIQGEIDKLVKERFNNDKKQFEDALKQYNTTIEDLKNDITTTLLAQKIATKDVTITDQEIQEYYDKNKESLGQREEVHARHILIKDEAKAKETYEKLKADANQFETLAKELSEDPGSKEKGGDLGFFGKGQMVPEFEKVAFEGKINEVNAPVKSEFGFHIIQVLEKKEAKIPTLDESKEQITKTLKEQKAKPYEDLINELRTKEKINISDQQYKDVLTPEAPPAGAEGQPAQ